MSCLMVTEESLSKIANFIEVFLNRGYEYTGIPDVIELCQTFNGCRDMHGTMQGKAIFDMIYEENLKAFKGRYKGENVLDAPIVYKELSIHKPISYMNGHYVIEEWHYQMKKHLDFLIYQLEEEVTASGDVCRALCVLNQALSQFIVVNNEVYCSLPWV